MSRRREPDALLPWSDATFPKFRDCLPSKGVGDEAMCDRDTDQLKVGSRHVRTVIARRGRWYEELERRAEAQCGENEIEDHYRCARSHVERPSTGRAVHQEVSTASPSVRMFDPTGAYRSGPRSGVVSELFETNAMTVKPCCSWQSARAAKKQVSVGRGQEGRV